MGTVPVTPVEPVTTPTTTTTTVTSAVMNPPLTAFKRKCDCWLWLLAGAVIGFMIAYFWFEKNSK